MIEREIFTRRIAVCRACPSWKNVCLKGHNLHSPTGCPERKFEPVLNAGYLPDKVIVPVEEAVGGPKCCNGPGDLKPMTYTQAVANFVSSMRAWHSAGYALVPDGVYKARLDVCKACPSGHYHWFQCKLCHCVMLAKAKLPTVKCDAGHWSALS